MSISKPKYLFKYTHEHSDQNTEFRIKKDLDRKKVPAKTILKIRSRTSTVVDLNMPRIFGTFLT